MGLHKFLSDQKHNMLVALWMESGLLSHSNESNKCESNNKNKGSFANPSMDKTNPRTRYRIHGLVLRTHPKSNSMKSKHRTGVMLVTLCSVSGMSAGQATRDRDPSHRGP